MGRLQGPQCWLQSSTLLQQRTVSSQWKHWLFFFLVSSRFCLKGLITEKGSYVNPTLDLAYSCLRPRCGASCPSWADHGGHGFGTPPPPPPPNLYHNLNKNSDALNMTSGWVKAETTNTVSSELSSHPEERHSTAVQWLNPNTGKQEACFTRNVNAPLPMKYTSEERRGDTDLGSSGRRSVWIH